MSGLSDDVHCLKLRCSARSGQRKEKTLEEYIDIQRYLLKRISQDYESSDLDYKRSIPWSSETSYSIIKDVMSFANFGGGYIVIGYDESAPNKEEKITGISDEHRTTWETTKVNQLINEFCAPPIDIELIEVPDNARDVTMLVLRIPSHGSVPHICKRQKGDPSNKLILRKAALYFRTKNKSCEEISDNQDYQDLIRRCLLNDRNSLLNDIKKVLIGQSSETVILTGETYDPFSEMDRFAENMKK